MSSPELHEQTNAYYYSRLRQAAETVLDHWENIDLLDGDADDLSSAMVELARVLASDPAPP